MWLVLLTLPKVKFPCYFSVIQGYNLSVFSPSRCGCCKSQVVVSFLRTYTTGFSRVKKKNKYKHIYVCAWLQDQAEGNVKSNLHVNNQYFY